MKIFFAMALLFLSPILHAAVLRVDNAEITRINSYDDYHEGVILICSDKTDAACSNGSYINQSSPGSERLYSLALAAFMGSKKISIQLYADQVLDGRCEIDAISVFK